MKVWSVREESWTLSRGWEELDKGSMVPGVGGAVKRTGIRVRGDTIPVIKLRGNRAREGRGPCEEGAGGTVTREV